MTRVAHRFTHERSSSPCSRCLTLVELVAGTWYAADADDLERPICDRCARVADPDGYAMVTAFRRMARPTRRAAA